MWVADDENTHRISPRKILRPRENPRLSRRTVPSRGKPSPGRPENQRNPPALSRSTAVRFLRRYRQVRIIPRTVIIIIIAGKSSRIFRVRRHRTAFRPYFDSI